MLSFNKEKKEEIQIINPCKSYEDTKLDKKIDIKKIRLNIKRSTSDSPKPNQSIKPKLITDIKERFSIRTSGSRLFSIKPILFKVPHNNSGETTSIDIKQSMLQEDDSICLYKSEKSDTQSKTYNKHIHNMISPKQIATNIIPLSRQDNTMINESQLILKKPTKNYRKDLSLILNGKKLSKPEIITQEQVKLMNSRYSSPKSIIKNINTDIPSQKHFTGINIQKLGLSTPKRVTFSKNKIVKIFRRDSNTISFD